MLDARTRQMFSGPLEAMARAIVQTGVPANGITFVGFGLGLIGVLFVATDALVLGAIFLGLNRLVDGLDGIVARKTGPSAVGEFLDAVFTHVLFAGMAFAFIVARQQFGLAGGFLLFSLLTVAVTDLGTRAFSRGGSRAEDQTSALIIVEKTETTLFFVIVLLDSLTFAFLPYMFGVLCFITASVRVAGVIAGKGATAKP